MAMALHPGVRIDHELLVLVVGLGIGSTIMPSMAAAFQTLSREETPRATTALNGGIQGLAALSRQQVTTPLLADAFGIAFWVAAGLIAVALVPALLLPMARPDQVDAPAAFESRAA